MPSNNGGRPVRSPDENRPSWRPHDQMRRGEDWERGSRRYRDEDERSFDRDRAERGRWGRLGGHWEDDRDESMRGRGDWTRDELRMRDVDEDRWARGGEHWQDRRDRMDRGMGERGMRAMGVQGGADELGMRGGEYGYGQYGRHGQAGGGYYGGGGSYGGGRRHGPQGMQGYGRQSMYGPHVEGYGRQGPGQGHTGGYGMEGLGHRGKGPVGFQRSDERIREIVCEALTDDDNVDASRIEVTVKAGEVILSGAVDDRMTKRMAEEAVERLPGVKDVQNQLRVQERRGNQNPPGTVGRNESEPKHRA